MSTEDTPPPQSAKLTRSFLMELCEGQILASNCFDAHGPVFLEMVAPREERVEQWRRIREQRADGRNCHVFLTQEGCQQWLNRVGTL